ncbi:hypothetical protein [Amycolatopsis albispora]|uniref:Phage head morphogenesis domain-containing protein n=1 Tax=Amycolatopsis albispora TaxID=1804986 RepID=A0A344LGY0_9PSEU|nr:hypothetical protein [Amycolatopsis albispora]AXB47304.1 hypothetical protein A4R43_36665 [Amycolatopsis albispora]
MTAANDPRPTIIQDHDGEALSLEEAAAIAAAGPVREALKVAVSWAHAEWARRFRRPRELQSGPAFQQFLGELVARLLGIQIDPAPALLEYAELGRLLGIEQGRREANVPPATGVPGISPETQLVVEHSVSRVREKLALAPLQVAGLQRGSLLTIHRALAPAQQAANIVERTARTVVNAELNEGLAEVIDETGARALWVAERDACVACLALSGHFARSGVFNWRRTFGKKAYPPTDASGDQVELTGPPRHPNCRCRLTPWIGHDTAAARQRTHDWAGAIADAQARGGQVAEAAARKAATAADQSAAYDLPRALRREAERSILNGYALPTESEGVRVRAAEKLLTQIGSGRNAPSPSGWKVPASVKKRAERALKQGTFITGPVPTNW